MLSYWGDDIWFGWVRNLYDLLDRLYILFYWWVLILICSLGWYPEQLIIILQMVQLFQKLMDYIPLWWSLCMMFRTLMGSFKEVGSMTDRDWLYFVKGHSCSTMMQFQGQIHGEQFRQIWKRPLQWYLEYQEMAVYSMSYLWMSWDQISDGSAFRSWWRWRTFSIWWVL